MVHLIQFSIRPALFYTLLGCVHLFDCMVPISRERIVVDPAGNVATQWQWHEVPVIPATRSSADNVGYPKHIAHHPHYNDHSVLFSQPQSAGHHNLLHPTNAFNHFSPTSVLPASVFIPLGPLTSAPPVAADARRHRGSRVPVLNADPFVPG